MYKKIPVIAHVLIKCPHCGHQVRKDEVCLYCGTKLEKNKETYKDNDVDTK
jgi:ribosomal protein L32